MAWCEDNQVDYLFGLARNARLEEAIRPELAQAKALSDQHQQPVRRFTDFRFRTLKSWSRKRRVVAKAEVLPRGPNPRFVVTSLSAHNHPAQPLYEQTYCARGEMENRSLRLKLLKIGAQITTSVRRIKVAMASGCPYQREFRLAWAQLPP